MKKKQTAAPAAPLLLTLMLAFIAPPASAQNIAQLRCADVDEEKIVPLAIWLDGYRAAHMKSTEADESWMTHVRDKLLMECEETPQALILPVIDEMIRRY